MWWYPLLLVLHSTSTETQEIRPHGNICIRPALNGKYYMSVNTSPSTINIKISESDHVRIYRHRDLLDLFVTIDSYGTIDPVCLVNPHSFPIKTEISWTLVPLTPILILLGTGCGILIVTILIIWLYVLSYLQRRRDRLNIYRYSNIEI